LTISTTIIALDDAFAGMTNDPDEVNSSYLRMPPLAAAAAHTGTPAVPTERT
jgi:hypothetical protein